MWHDSAPTLPCCQHELKWYFVLTPPLPARRTTAGVNLWEAHELTSCSREASATEHTAVQCLRAHKSSSVSVVTLNRNYFTSPENAAAFSRVIDLEVMRWLRFRRAQQTQRIERSEVHQRGTGKKEKKRRRKKSKKINKIWSFIFPLRQKNSCSSSMLLALI